MSRASIVLLILFSIALFVALMTAAANPRHLPQMELTIDWLRHAMGSLLAIAAALAILIRSLNGKSLNELLVFIVALFAALALLAPSWSLTFSLGAIVVLVLLKGLVSRLVAKD